MELKKPESYEELLEAQKILNEGIPKLKTEFDIILALDDEFQEWLKELPQEYNFKNWKKKEYSREKELEELTDILFFILQLANRLQGLNIFYRSAFKLWDNIKENIEFNNEDIRTSLIWNMKHCLYEANGRDISNIMLDYILICCSRNFTKKEILDKYWEKWQKDMKRPSRDWNLKEEDD